MCVLAILGTWTVLAVALFLWCASESRKETRERAISTARAHFHQDQALRLWAASHGGVYVAADENTPPHPCLAAVPERNIETPSGRRLTLINPAYIIRQMNETYADLADVFGHITTLSPLRPENVPDDWEYEALRSFERGSKEEVTVTTIGGEPFFRLMRPMITVKSCLKCHENQGYDIGDIRGGVSVSLPMASALAQERQEIHRQAGALALVWLLGLGGIGWGTRIVQSRVRERDKVEAEMRLSRQQYRTLANLSSDFIYWQTIGGQLMYVTAACEVITGYSPDEFLANPTLLAELFQGSDRERFERHRTGSVDGVADQPIQLQLVTKQGNRRWINHAARPIFDDSGALLGIHGTLRDITEQKSSERKLSDLAAKADAATRAKSEFLANMSHEIRTPMTAIMGFTETMLDPDISQSVRLNAIHTVRRNGEHLLQLINDILDLSKIEAGKLAVEAKRLHLPQLLADVTNLMNIRAEMKGLLLTVEYATAIPETIQSDATRLRQILVNLVGNALKFTDKGSIRIVVRLVPANATAAPGSSTPLLQFDVVDTGIGMTREQMSHLFQPFGQVDTSTSRRFGGTGLGLQISKRLANMLGGTITVKSEIGVGSTFQTTISPGSLAGVTMLDAPTAASTGNASKPAPTSRDCGRLDGHVLLVEDSPDNQALIRLLLEKAGATVTVADNGSQALRTVESARARGAIFDIILMDMQMPMMDGYDATRHLRQMGYGAPIIALTAHAMAGDRQKCLDAGCSDYLSKPINRLQMIETLQKWLHTTAEMMESTRRID